MSEKEQELEKRLQTSQTLKAVELPLAATAGALGTAATISSWPQIAGFFSNIGSTIYNGLATAGNAVGGFGAGLNNAFATGFQSIVPTLEGYAAAAAKPVAGGLSNLIGMGTSISPWLFYAGAISAIGLGVTGAIKGYQLFQKNDGWRRAFRNLGDLALGTVTTPGAAIALPFAVVIDALYNGGRAIYNSFAHPEKGKKGYYSLTQKLLEIGPLRALGAGARIASDIGYHGLSSEIPYLREVGLDGLDRAMGQEKDALEPKGGLNEMRRALYKMTNRFACFGKKSQNYNSDLAYRS